MNRSILRHSRGYVLALLCIDLCVGFAYWLGPKALAAVTGHMPVCPMYALGLRCGLCGGSHALWDIVNGHPWRSLQENLLLMPFLAAQALALVLAHVCLVLPAPGLERLYRYPWWGRWIAGWALAWLGYTILRNILLLRGIFL